ncbi:MAG TPA: cardiolipin synthase ClsB [Azoarcus sp.]|nr:cardiolipin synthase ClsB [Azoarcus sp.]
MSTFLGGNRVALLENGEQYFPDVLEAIEHASREIHVETYIFANDATGKRVANALIRAVRRGVHVRVLVDGFGSREFVAELMPDLLAEGVEVLVYRRDRGDWRIKRHRFRRMHRKNIVIDGRIAWVGGINIVDDFALHNADHPRFDYAIRLEGPLVGSVLHAVRQLWMLVSWASFNRRSSSGHLSSAPPRVGNIRAAFVLRDNVTRRRDIEEAYLNAINAARNEVTIACAYFFPGGRFRQALVDAARRGVRVTLLLQGLADHPMLAHATRALYPYFMRNGIRLFEYHRSCLHAKVAVVDQYWATVGSSNIDPFSLLLAREANVVIEDESFARQLQSSLERAIETGAEELCPENWSRRPWYRRMQCWICFHCVRRGLSLVGFRNHQHDD